LFYYGMHSGRSANAAMVIFLLFGSAEHTKV